MHRKFGAPGTWHEWVAREKFGRVRLGIERDFSRARELRSWEESDFELERVGRIRISFGFHQISEYKYVERIGTLNEEFLRELDYSFEIKKHPCSIKISSKRKLQPDCRNFRKQRIVLARYLGISSTPGRLPLSSTTRVVSDPHELWSYQVRIKWICSVYRPTGKKDPIVFYARCCIWQS